jgi:hypothetical protein
MATPRNRHSIKTPIRKSSGHLFHQVNRAIRIEHIMKRGLFGGFGLGDRLSYLLQSLWTPAIKLANVLRLWAEAS